MSAAATLLFVFIYIATGNASAAPAGVPVAATPTVKSATPARKSRPAPRTPKADSLQKRAGKQPASPRPAGQAKSATQIQSATAPRKPAPNPTPRTWTPTAQLRLTGEYDETVQPRMGRTNEAEPDFIASIAPSLGLRYQKGKTRISSSYGYRYQAYEENSERDSSSHRGRINLDQTLTERWSLSLDESFAYYEDSGGESNDTFIRPSTYYDNSAGMQNVVRWPDNVQWKIITGTDFRDYDRKGFNSYYSYDLGLIPEITLNSRLKLLFDYRYRDLNVEDGEDSTTHRIMGGASYEITRSLSGTLKIGALLFPPFSEEEFAAEAGLNYRVNGNLTLNAYYTRDASVTTGRSLISRRDLAGLSARWKFAERWDLLGSASYLFDSSIARDTVRTETIRTNMVLGYEVVKWFRTELNWGYTWQEAQRASGIDLNGHRVGISAVFTY